MSNLPGDIPPVDGWQQLSPSLPPFGILAGLNEQSLETLATYGLYLHARGGDQIITEGRNQDRLYILVVGKLQIFALVNGALVSLAEVEPGECIGEVTVLVPGPAATTVRVVEDSVLWSMDADSLHNYIADHPGGGGIFLMGMAQTLCNRLREADQRIIENNIAPGYTPQRMEAIITAPTASEVSLFEKIKKSLIGSEKKVRISTEIKL